jgi:hypothetical protein
LQTGKLDISETLIFCGELTMEILIAGIFLILPDDDLCLSLVSNSFAHFIPAVPLCWTDFNSDYRFHFLYDVPISSCLPSTRAFLTQPQLGQHFLCHRTDDFSFVSSANLRVFQWGFQSHSVGL